MIGQHMEVKIWTCIPQLMSFIFLGDFNAGMEHYASKDFCNFYFLTSLINKSTYWKNPTKPTCTDVVLTNSPKFFQKTNVIETGLSDFQKWCLLY